MVDFWIIIGTNELTSGKSVTAALAKVKRRLAANARSQSQLAEFDQWLQQQIDQLDRKQFFDLPVFAADGRKFSQTEDHFLYARCACILTGTAAMTGVLAGRRSFEDFAAIRLQRAELLLYLAAEISDQRQGT
jgi:Protein of unknown function (DUF4240)